MGSIVQKDNIYCNLTSKTSKHRTGKIDEINHHSQGKKIAHIRVSMKILISNRELGLKSIYL